MKTIRALFTGLGIWTAGVGLFVLSYLIPILENTDFQANLVLALWVPVFVWLGSHYYYKKGLETHGLKLGLLFMLVAIVLDAAITVPVLLKPYNETHLSFFTDPSFWLIAIEIVVVATAYYYLRVQSKSITLNN